MLIKKLIKFQFKNILWSIYFINLSNKLKLKNLADEIFESKTKLVGIDYYWSPQSDDPVLPWHVDQAYGGRKNPKSV